jgi:hypothetical protein
MKHDVRGAYLSHESIKIASVLRSRWGQQGLPNCESFSLAVWRTSNQRFLNPKLHDAPKT